MSSFLSLHNTIRSNIFALYNFKKMVNYFHIKILLLGLGLVVVAQGLPSSASKNYTGYQVLRVKIQTDDHLNAIRNLPVVVDFWNEPEVGGRADIMVSPDNIFTVTGYLTGKKLSWTVWIPDVGRIIEDQQNNARDIGDSGAGVGPQFWTLYQRLNSIFTWMDNLSAEYPSFVSTHTIGNSYENRSIRLIKVSVSANPDTNATSRPSVLFDSGIHAREWISPATLTYILDHLIKDPQYSDILASLDLYAVPVLNPDGYEYTHTTDRMWRKNRRPHSTSNCVGADLNRNFPFSWCSVGGSTNPCLETYCGSGPGSEPEVQVIMNYLGHTEINWWGYVTLHSYAQEWCIPWAYTATHAPDYDDMWDVGRKAVDALEATHGTQYTLKIPSGRYGGFSMDWAKGVRGIKYPVLIELRDTGRYGFILPADQIVPSGEETLAAIVVYLREIITQAGR